VPVHPRGDLHLGAHMPAGPITHQHHLLAVPGPDGLGTLPEGHRERRDRDGGQPPPHAPAARRRHEGIEGAPLVTVLDDRLRPLPAAAPHTPHAGREPEAVLVCRPQLHDVPGGGLLRRLDDRRELF
jgi:hypothetical protein